MSVLGTCGGIWTNLNRRKVSIYGARDIIMDLKENQQRLERELGRLVGINGRPAERPLGQ